MIPEFVLICIVITALVKYRNLLINLPPFFIRNYFWNGYVQTSLLAYVKKHATRGNAESVIRTIDKFSTDHMWSFVIGDVKGKILDSAVQECDPVHALELGSFCGYSTTRIARFLKEGARLISIEIDPISAQVAREVVEFAGLKDKVVIVTGPSSDIIATLREKFDDVETFGFVFFDHSGTLYAKDLQLLDDLGFVQKGSVLLADNVRFLRDDYVKLVSSERYKTTRFNTEIEYVPEMGDVVLKSERIK